MWEVIRAWDIIVDILYIFFLKFVLNAFWSPLIHIFLKKKKNAVFGMLIKQYRVLFFSFGLVPNGD